MSDIISMIVREFLFSGTNIVMLTIFTAHMLKRKRPYTAWVIVCVLKTILVNLIVAVPLGEVLQTDRALQGLYIIISIILSLALYLALFYVFEGERVKIIVVATISEMLAVCITNPVNMCLNAMSGRSPVEEYRKFHVCDLLFIVLVFVTPLICKILEPVFKRLRAWEIKHKKLWTILIVLYLSVAIHSNFVRFKQNMLEMYFIVAVVLLCGFLWYTRLFYRKAAWEREYLRKQQRLSKMQYSAIALQVEMMEQAQREINEQMQRFMDMPKDEGSRTKLVENYIRGLKRQSNAIMQGMFCDSWFLDSVLCYQMMKCKDKQIDTDFRLQKYSKGEIREENLAELVNYLLESFAAGNAMKRISLQMASVKGQLILSLTGDGKHVEISKRKIRKYMRGYQTVVSQNVTNEQIELRLTIA